MRHAAIIPLIGGEVLASDQVYGTKPEYIMTYSGFMDNEKHLINHYKENGYDVPYYVLDSETAPTKFESVDVVSSVCPCAGLSSYHSSYGEHNQNNQWMEKSTRMVLNEVRPKVLWGENAPALATSVGKFMRDKLLKIADEAGYNMSIFVTKTLLHGNPQIRRRTFYFFWRRDFFNNKIPVFNYYKREHPTIRDLLIETKTNFQTNPINPKIPSKDDPYYRYFLEEVKGGMSHKDFAQSLVDSDYDRPSFNVESEMILTMKVPYENVAKWMSDHGYEREADKCMRRDAKLKSGKGVMWRGTVVPVHHIGAFVVHMPFVVTHPVEDRYINYREAMTIMGLPQDYELLDPERSINHICQNVPFKTAGDMATEVQAAIRGERQLEQASFLIQDNLSQRLRENTSNFNIMEFAQ
jgi:site-specific DNA-cytosine methylase